MTRRRMIKVGLVFALLVAVGAAAIWHSELIGLWRGEAAYQGRYTNSWRAELARWNVAMSSGGRGFMRWHRERWPSSWEVWLERLTGSRGSTRFDDIPLVQGDPDAVPVLLELLEDPALHIRSMAVDALGKVGPAARAAVPALFERLNEPDLMMRMQVEDALYAIDYDAARRARLGQGRWWR